MSQPTWAPCLDCTTPETCGKSTGGCMRVGNTYFVGRVTQHEIWAPTLELRYIRRQVKPGWFETTLQQRWIRQGGSEMSLGGIEWRDVPIATEEQG